MINMFYLLPMVSNLLSIIASILSILINTHASIPGVYNQHDVVSFFDHLELFSLILKILLHIMIM